MVIGWLGARELAASNIALTLNLVAFLPAMGIGQAVEVIVGKYQGEERPDLSAQRAYTGFALAWTFMAIMALGYVTIPDLMLLPFRREETAEDIAMAAVLLRFVACYCLFDAGNSVFSFALRGAGDTRFVMRVVSALPWVGMVAPVWIVYKCGGGIYGIWAVASAYIALQAMVFYLRFRHGAWRTMKVIEAVEDESPTDAMQPQAVAH
jgi:MATE family, multidrug efflux pump